MYIGDMVFQLAMIGILLGVFALFVFCGTWFTRSAKRKKRVIGDE